VEGGEGSTAAAAREKGLTAMAAAARVRGAGAGGGRRGRGCKQRDSHREDDTTNWDNFSFIFSNTTQCHTP
jgi:hypothetical protein